MKHAQALTLWALIRILGGVERAKISPLAILNRTNYTVIQEMKTIATLASCITLTLSSCALSEDAKIEKPPVIEASTWKSKYYKPSHPKFTKATPANEYRENGDIKYIVFHHADASAKTKKEADEITALGDSVWVNHATINDEGLCFQDVAYHYLIGQSGRIFKGRPDNIAPASGTFYLNTSELDRPKYKDNGAVDYAKLESGKPPGYNQGYLTICFLVKNEEPSDDAKASAVKLAASLMSEHSIPIQNIRTHREIANSSCPGNKIQMWIRGELTNRGTRMKGDGITAIEALLK